MMKKYQDGVQPMRISEVKSRLNSLVNEIYRNETRIVVEKSGIPVAAIVPIADLQRLGQLDDLDAEARDVLKAMRAPFQDESPEEIERQTERILQEIRAENRAVQQRAARSA